MKTSMITLLLTIISIILSACGSDTGSKDSGDRPVAVTIVPVVKAKPEKVIHASGILRNRYEIKMAFPTGGIIDRINVNEGDRVQANYVLADLVKTEFRAYLAQAKSGYDKAVRDEARAKGLYLDSVVTREQFDNVKTALTVAKANLKLARFNLNYASLRASAPGTVLKVLNEENEVVGPGSPVLIIGLDQSRWMIRTGLSDRTVLQVHNGDPVQVSFDPYPGVEFTGTVDAVSGIADPASGLFEVEILINDQGKRLYSGFVGKVRIFPQTAMVLDRIPLQALAEADGAEGTVYMPSADRSQAEKRIIHIAVFDSQYIYADTGLEDVKELFGAGVKYLSDGRAVRVIEGAN